MNGFRPRRAIAAQLLCIVAASGLGCYTFRPSSELDRETLETVGRSARPIVLVVSSSYETYTSRDRGHPLADPQVYRVGEALASLTEEYFRHAFSRIVVVRDMEITAKIAEGRLIVSPEVSSFENTLTMFPTTQTLEVSLSAQIVNDAGATIGRAEGHGSNTHRVHALRDDERRIGSLLGEVIQRALAGLVNDTVRKVEASSP